MNFESKVSAIVIFSKTQPLPFHLTFSDALELFSCVFVFFQNIYPWLFKKIVTA